MVTTIYPRVEGNYLTQLSLKDENSRVFIKSLSGVSVNADLWRDASSEEKEQWEKEHPVEPEPPEQM